MACIFVGPFVVSAPLRGGRTLTASVSISVTPHLRVFLWPPSTSVRAALEFSTWTDVERGHLAKVSDEQTAVGDHGVVPGLAFDR